MTSEPKTPKTPNTSTVVGLFGERIHAFNNEADPDVIAQLEVLLAQAKNGEIASFAFASLGPTNALGICVAGQFTVLQLRGAVAILEDYVRDSGDDLEIIIPGPLGAD